MEKYTQRNDAREHTHISVLNDECVMCFCHKDVKNVCLKTVSELFSMRNIPAKEKYGTMQIRRRLSKRALPYLVLVLTVSTEINWILMNRMEMFGIKCKFTVY